MTKVTVPPEPPNNKPSTEEIGWLKRVVRGFLAILGLILILIGVIIGWATPGLPFGLLPGIIGVILLGTNSTTGRNWMESVLTKRPMLEWLAPHWLMKRVFNREKRPLEVLNPKRAAKLKAKKEAKEANESAA